MKAYFKVIAVLQAAFLTALFSGCGYQAGSIMHPQVKSIAVAPVTNETLEPNASAYMRQSLAEQFEFDNSLEVKGLDAADCVIYGRILKVETTTISFDSSNNQQSYVPAEFTLKLTFEFAVIIPGRSKLLINTREVIGEAKYQVAADHDIARRRGIQQACRNAAQKVVIYTVEAW